MSVSVVIVNWNTTQVLGRCLASLEAFAPAAEVWVVDNASTDDGLDALQEAYPTVRWMLNSTNEGFAKAVNQVLRRLDNDYVALLNPDTELVEPSLDKVIAYMADHPRVGVLGCTLRYPDGRLQASIAPFPRLRDYGRESLQRLGVPTWPGAFTGFDYDRTQRVEGGYPMGAFLVVSKVARDIVGLMDERFSPAYLEETDWCHRIAKTGFGIVYFAETKVLHHHGYSIRRVDLDFRDFLTLRTLQNRFYYFKKHYGSVQALVLRGFILLESLIFVGLAGLRFVTRRTPDARRSLGLQFRRLFCCLNLVRV